VKSRKIATLWNIFFHYYAFIFAIIWGIIMVPLYLKHISLEIYGGWLASGNIISWLTIIDPGLSDVLRQKVALAYGAKNKNKLQQLFWSGITFSAIIAIVALIIGISVSFFVFDFINIKNQGIIEILSKNFILATIGSSLMIFSYGLVSYNQGLLSSKGIGMIHMFSTLLSLITNIYLINVGYGIYAITISQILCALVIILGNIGYLILRFIKESISFSWSLSELIPLMKLSSYNILGKLGNIIANQTDILLVTRFLGPEISPVINLTKKGPELSRMFVERPAIAMQPAITHAWGSGEKEKISFFISRLFKIMIWMIGLLFIGFVVLNKSFVSLWVGSKLYTGDTINFLLCLSLIFSILISINSNFLFALGNIKKTSQINFFQSILTIFCLFLGIKYFGLLGLVLGQSIAMLLFSVWYFPYKTFQCIKFSKYELTNMRNELIFVMGISGLIFLLFHRIQVINDWYLFSYTVLLIIIIYVLLLYSVSKLFREELKTVLNHKRKMKIFVK
jgi:O-antigen/teichoic acid export membrane protein